MDSLLRDVLLELIKALFVVIGTVFIGQRLVASWQFRNKRKELEIASATVFQQLYGEFKDIWRVWKVIRNPPEHGPAVPSEARFDLLTRATAAEAKLEALVVKLAVERELSDDEIQTIGLFRQGYQLLRQRIRDNESMDYRHNHPEYRLFNDLATRFASILLADPPEKRPAQRKAGGQLETISNIRVEDWNAAKKRYPDPTD